MHISALHHAGSLLDLTTTAKRLTAPSDMLNTSDTFQQTLAADAPNADAPQDVPPTADETANTANQAPANSTLPEQQLTAASIAATSPASIAADSLMDTLKSYTSANQGSSQAYQEYAKAWGGRVVHGQVELPPLSIYLE